MTASGLLPMSGVAGAAGDGLLSATLLLADGEVTGGNWRRRQCQRLCTIALIASTAGERVAATSRNSQYSPSCRTGKAARSGEDAEPPGMALPSAG